MIGFVRQASFRYSYRHRKLGLRVKGYGNRPAGKLTFSLSLSYTHRVSYQNSEFFTFRILKRLSFSLMSSVSSVKSVDKKNIYGNLQAIAFPSIWLPPSASDLKVHGHLRLIIY